MHTCLVLVKGHTCLVLVKGHTCLVLVKGHTCLVLVKGHTCLVLVKGHTIGGSSGNGGLVSAGTFTYELSFAMVIVHPVCFIIAW